MTQNTPVPHASREAFILTGAFRVICRNSRYLQELADRGLAVLVISLDSCRDQAEKAMADPDNPASWISETAYVSGSLDRESSFTPGVFAVLQRWRDQYRVRGVFAMEETLVEPTGMVCDVLGLPGVGLRAGRVCRSKYLQRAYLEALGPRTLTVPPGGRGSGGLGALRYPVVVKPATRHASSGVVSCDTPEEAASVMTSYPDHETLLVEERVNGQEYSVESLVQEGRTVFSSLTRKETTGSGSGFVELSHTVPGAAPDASLSKKILQANASLLGDLSFENGVTHSEWRIDGNGQPRLMEVAARTPGDGITALYELACGKPMEAPIVRIALGETASYPHPRRVARQVYLEHPHGVLEDVTLDWSGIRVTWLGRADLWPRLRPGVPGDAPALRGVLVFKERGTLLGDLASSDDRAVSFLVDADTEAELDELEARVRSAISIRVKEDTRVP